MNKVTYENIGSSGLRISRLSFGTYRTVGFNQDTSHLIECLKCAINNGVNYFDTADSYADGDAEIILGKSLKEFSRGDYVISTKCYFPRSNIPSNSGLSRKHIYDSINQSLKNLNLDYVDLFYFHRYDNKTPLYESINAISDLIRSGKVLYWGMSRFDMQHVSEVLSLLKTHSELIPPICNQWFYNMLSRDIESGLIDYCVNNQISIIAYSILGQGFLSDKNLKSTSVNTFPILGGLSHNASLNLLKDLSNISSDLGITLSHLAISWVFYNKKISSGICGASNINQLLENIDSAADCFDESTYHSINKILNSYK